jgi:hypothetical protein
MSFIRSVRENASFLVVMMAIAMVALALVIGTVSLIVRMRGG